MELQQIESRENRLYEYDYGFIALKDKHNQLDFVHITLAKKLASACSKYENGYYWRDDPSLGELLSIKDDVYFDIRIDVIDEECSMEIEGVYLPTNLPNRTFNSIVNNLYNAQLKSKTTVNGCEFIFFSWD